MNIDPKYLAIALLISAALGAFITREYAPREVVKTQIVEHTVVQEQASEKDKNVITTKIIVNKDGSKEIDTTKTEDISKTDNKSTTDNKNTTITDNKASTQKQWFATIGYGLSTNNGFQNTADPIYKGSINRRILGPLYLGIWGTTTGEGGVSAGLEF